MSKGPRMLDAAREAVSAALAARERGEAAIHERVREGLFDLGLSAMLVAPEAGGARVVIGGYLSDSLAVKYRGTPFPHARLAPPPVAPGALRDVDLVLATHGHTDHLDPGTLPGLSQAKDAPLEKEELSALIAHRSVLLRLGNVDQCARTGADADGQLGLKRLGVDLDHVQAARLARRANAGLQESTFH